MQILQADPTRDLAILEQLWRDYFTWANDELEAHWGFRLPADEILEQTLDDLDLFAPPQGRLYLAVDGTDALGVGCLRALDDTTGEIKRMYVRPDARGRGIGRALLGALLQAAREVGYRRIRLDSGSFMQGAHALYRSAGFVEIDPYPESEIPPELRGYWVFMQREL